ncbi:hypothetical protein D3C76_1071600 [compost metagenome]
MAQVEQLTLFQGDTLANLLVMPGSDKARKMTATSGQRYTAYYKRSDPVGLLVKMLLDTSLWASTMCFLTWETSGTPHNRLLFRLLPSVPRTEEIESSLWATPQARDFRSGDNPDSPRKARKQEQGWSQNLNDQVKMWPTPVSSDHKRRGPNSKQQGLPETVRMWPTPKATLRGDCPSERERRTPDLHAAVKMWPTPTASQDWKPIRTLAPSEANGTHGTMLVGAVGHQHPEKVGGQMNPDWVECLMGFPIGWSDIHGRQDKEKNNMIGSLQE